MGGHRRLAMLTLSLLRHAKSSWDRPGLDDFDRPLAKRGQTAAPQVGAALAAMGVNPDLILCSTAARARETLDLVLPKLASPPPEVKFDETLYMAAPSDLLACIHNVESPLNGRPMRHVMVVGHNPGLEELAMMLVGSGAEDDVAAIAEKFPTAAVAIIAFDTEDWSLIEGGRGRLEHFLTPSRLP